MGYTRLMMTQTQQPELASRLDNYTLDVANFGPVAYASVEMRPLTVFIGPSNTGKSYLAILAYAMHNCFSGPWALRGPTLDVNSRLANDASKYFSDKSETAERLYAWLSPNNHDQKFPPQDILDSIREILERREIPERHEDADAFLDYSVVPGFLRGGPKDSIEFIDNEVRRCFGVERIGDLVRRPGAHRDSLVTVSSEVQLSETKLGYRFGFDTDGDRFARVVPGKSDDPLSQESIASIAVIARAALHPSVFNESGYGRANWDFFERLYSTIVGGVTEDAMYLPADRTGVMHSHQIVVNTLVQNATTAGINPSLNVPLLSGVLADFLGGLIRMSVMRARRNDHHFDRSLELAMLDGAILMDNPDTGYPSFSYRPSSWDVDIPLARASSMVSELAPVVLYLRYLVRPGTLLIIEEPESHLHPGMQATFARELARLVNSGVRVLLTTHSDWFLEQIGNLIRLGMLPEENRAGIDNADCALAPEDVGAWLFASDDHNSGTFVQEVTLDSETGLFPTDYDPVSEALYNESAHIFNRMQEAKGE